MSFYSKYAGEEVEQRLDAVSEIAGQVGDISGALSEVSGKVGEVSEHLASVDASVVAVGNKVDGVVASVDGVSSRVDANATNIAEVAEKVGSIEKDVDVIDESVGALGERVQELGSLTTSVENLSANVTAIGRGVEQLAERVENVASELDNKQGVLESGVNVKTINGESILGAGDIKVQGSGIGGEVEDVTEIQGNEFVLLMDGDKVLRVPMSVLKAWLGVPSEPSEPDQPDEPTTPDVDENGYIVFADEEVKRVLMANGVSSDGVGITKADAEKVTSIGTWFDSNTAIDTFNEFEKFEGVTSLTGGASNNAASAFRKSTIRSIKLPYNLTSIGNYVFYNCTNLENIENTEKITNIGAWAFADTSVLAISISFPSLTSLGFKSFHNSGITSVNDLGTITSIQDGNYMGGTNQGVFSSCDNLTKVVLPETLTSIGSFAFYQSSNITAINIPSSVVKIGENAFHSCTSLEIEDLSLPNLESLGRNAFYGVKIKKISDLGKITALPNASSNTQNFGDKNVLEEVVLPDGLNQIVDYSFFNYTNLSSCKIPDEVNSIGASAFKSTKVKKVNLKGVTKLGKGSFRETLIELVDLPNIEEIGGEHGNGAFYRCYSLRTVIIGINIASIGSTSFGASNALDTLVIKAVTPPSIGEYALTNTNSSLIIYVPDESVTAYQEATNWSSYASRIKGISELPIDNPTLYDEIKDYLG